RVVEVARRLPEACALRGRAIGAVDVEIVGPDEAGAAITREGRQGAIAVLGGVEVIDAGPRHGHAVEAVREAPPLGAREVAVGQVGFRPIACGVEILGELAAPAGDGKGLTPSGRARQLAVPT